jgi:hypothetical protein
LDHERGGWEPANVFEGHVDDVLDPERSDKFSVGDFVGYQKDGLDGMTEGDGGQLDSL